MDMKVEKLPLVEAMRKSVAAEMMLPRFQRKYVWSESDVIALLTSVMKRRPVGSLLILEPGELSAALNPRMIEGVAAPDTLPKSPPHVLLDGQQRVTTLTGALSRRGVPGAGDAPSSHYFLDVNTLMCALLKDMKNADANVFVNVGQDLGVSDPEYRALRSATLHALSDMDDEDFARCLSAKKDKSPPKGSSAPELGRSKDSLKALGAEGSYPLFKITASPAQGVKDYWWEEFSESHSDEETAVLRVIVNEVAAYDMVAVYLGADTTLAEIAAVYTNINKGGTDLSTLDLLDSVLFQKTNGGTVVSCAEDWESLKSYMGATAGLHTPPPKKSERGKARGSGTPPITQATRGECSHILNERQFIHLLTLITTYKRASRSGAAVTAQHLSTAQSATLSMTVVEYVESRDAAKAALGWLGKWMAINGFTS